MQIANPSFSVSEWDMERELATLDAAITMVVEGMKQDVSPHEFFKAYSPCIKQHDNVNPPLIHFIFSILPNS